MNIGEKLKSYRLYRGMTQEDLASAAGINDKYYGRIERNESCPTLDKLAKLCKALRVEMVELFLFELNEERGNFSINQEVSKAIINGLQNDIDIHFNRYALQSGCVSCIWYSGYIGSMCFDEFELKLYATGNVKGNLYLDYKEVLELNGDDIANELKKYVHSDRELSELIEYMPYDVRILNEKNGNVLFLLESNWLSATLVNNNTGEILDSEIILDTDNIIEGLNDKKTLFDLIF